MEFRMSDEQKAFERVVREYCQKNVEPRSREIDEAEAGIPEDMIKGLADIGVFGCTIPEEYGGSAPPGEEMQYASIAIREIARAELSVSLPVYTLLTIGWGGQFLKLYAREELKEEILPKLASGEWFWGVCVTEPGGGSDVAAIKSTATKKDGKFRIDGEKAYISGVTESQVRGGGHCGLFYTDRARGIKGGMTLMALIPNMLNGVTTTTYKEMGRMGLSSGGFFYSGTEVPERYVLGEEGKGFYYCMEGFNIARALVASACLGTAEKCLEMSVDYVRQRMAFGQPIGKFEGVSFQMAEDYTRLEMLKLLLQKGCWMIDKHYSEPSSVAQKDINVVIAQCKWMAPLIAVEVAQHAIMWHGAFGYTRECSLEMALRGLMSYVAGAEGATNIMKLIVVRDAFGNDMVATR
jgi:acyl-CoA dehydrogenase